MWECGESIVQMAFAGWSRDIYSLGGGRTDFGFLGLSGMRWGASEGATWMEGGATGPRKFVLNKAKSGISNLRIIGNISLYKIKLVGCTRDGGHKSNN